MPLPPLGIDTYRRWAADRWKGVTDATIGRVQSGLWDVQASSAIDALGAQLARMREQQDLQRQQQQEQERQRQEAVRAQLEEDRRRREAEAAQRRAALSSTVGGALGGIGERVGAGFSGLGGRASTALSGARDWSSRADAAIDDLGGQLGGGFAGAQAAPLPTLEAPSTYEPSTPLEQAGALASRIPRAAAQPFQDLTRRVQQSSAGTSGALQGFGVPEGVADVAGFGVGALSVPGAVAGSSVQSAAERAGLPEAQLQGDIADILAPFPGTQLGALTRPRVAGLLAGPAIGATAGALLAPTEDGTAPQLEDRVRGGLKGAALGLSVGPDAADLATGLPYVFGRVGRAARQEFGEAPGILARNADAIDAQAVTDFGPTRDLAEAGYLQRDGTLLDFSGKREGGSRGMRSYDHRQVGQVLQETGRPLPEGGTAQMLQFMEDTGAVRMDGQGDYLTVQIPGGLSARQRRALLDRARDFQGAVVEVTDPTGRSVQQSLEVDFPSGRRQFNQLINAIPDHVAPGATPSGDVLGIRRGQRFRMPALTPEQQAQRARDGAAEQRMFEAMLTLQRRNLAEVADDLRLYAMGKGESGEQYARAMLKSAGLEGVLPRPTVALPNAAAFEDAARIDPLRSGPGTLVSQGGRTLGPDDVVEVYHATSPETAAAMVTAGVRPGGKVKRARTVIESETVAQMLGKRVGDVLDYEPGVGMGEGLYVGATPEALSQYGDAVVGVRVRVRDLLTPPERRVGSPVGAVLKDDGYLERAIDPADIRLVSGGTGAVAPGGVGIASPSTETGDGLLGLARRATEPLMARGAVTPGERAFDVAAGTAGGVAGAATAEEDATWQERLGRGLAGASLGALGGANLRQLGRVGQRALADGEALGVAAGRPLLPSDREAMRRATAAGRAAPPEVLERLAGLQEEATAAATATDPARRASLLGNVLEVFNNYSLAGPLSLLTNLTGGLTQTALNVGEAVGAAGPRGALTYARGAAGAVPRALREGGRVFVEGTQARGTPLGGTTQELAVAGGLSEGRGLGRTVGSWATRLNAATDRAIWAVNDAGARQVGEQLGFRGQRLEDFAKRYAEEATFAGKPSALGELLTKARGTLSDPSASNSDRLWGGFVYALAPYIRVPERILRQAGDLTTLGAANWNKLLAKDPAVRAHARGRIGAATATTLALAYQAAQGAVTGDGPDDPDERAALEARTNEAGDPLWRRNSWRVEVPGAGPEGTSRLFWFPNRALGAVGTQMDLIANAVDAYERESAKGGDAPTSAWAGGKAVVNEVVATALGDSWLDDMTRFAERSRKGQFLEAAGEQLAGFAGRPLAVAAPLARATDPYAREVERGDVIGRTLERLPGARETLPARIDPTTGEPVRQGGTPLQRAVGATPPVATAARAETARLASLKGPDGKALYPGVLPRVFDEAEVTYAGAKQTPAQKRVLQQAYGSESGRYLAPLLASQAYQRATDAEKAAMVQRALRTVAKEADVRAGTRIARDPKNRAAWEYLAVPHYAGVDPKAAPDEVRRQNLRIAEAKAQLAAFRARYPQQPQRGEAELAQADRELYALAKRPPVPKAYLDAQREAIKKRVGVAPDDDPEAVILAGAVRP